jgi:hypothetical protein
MDSNFRFLVARPSNRYGRRDYCLEKRKPICWGTEGSNPAPSSGESGANSTSARWFVFVDARCTSATGSRSCWKRRSPPATADFATCDIPSPRMPGITWRGVAPTRPKLDAATMAPSPRRLSHTSRRMALRRRFHRQGRLAASCNKSRFRESNGSGSVASRDLEDCVV